MALIGSAGGHSWPPAAIPQGGPLDEYDVEVNGMMTTLHLNAQEAAARGLTKKVTPAEDPAPARKQAPAPKNKARSASVKADD